MLNITFLVLFGEKTFHWNESSGLSAILDSFFDIITNSLLCVRD